MALINTPSITSQIAALANSGTIDTNQIVTLLNSALPAGQQISTVGETITGIYKRFGEFDKVNAKVEIVTTGLWANDSGSLNVFFTASSQTTAQSGKYYYNVYDQNPLTSETEEVQFAIAYGHVDGSGSVDLATDDNALLPTKATYAQYKSMLLDPTDTKFSFDNSSAISTDANGIYIINVARARYREKMDAGNWSLKLSGSNGLFTFIDNSGKKFGDSYGLSGNVFKVVSGSLNLGTQSEATVNTATDATSGEGFGEFYPDRGIIILNAKAVGNVVGNVFNEAFQTVGLLNDANELIAVAKTSQPIVKSFDKEVLIKVKLSF